MQPANPVPEAQPLSSNEFWPKPLNLDRPSEIDHDIALGPRAAYQRIAVGRRLNRVGPIADVAADERRLAIVADPVAARPSHRYIARLGHLQEALERRVQTDIEAAAREGYQRPRADGFGRRVRRLERSRGNSRCQGRTRSERLGVNAVGGYSPGCEAGGQIGHKGRRPA